MQASPTVHAFRSLHDVPSATVVVALHVPEAGSHACAPAHIVAPGHAMTLLPTQAPPWHVSVCVQGLPSLHAIVLLVCTQPVAGLQLSVVHELPSSHEIGVLVHAPPEHVPLPGTWHRSVTGQGVGGVVSAFWQVPVALQALHVPQPVAGALQQKPSVHRPAAH
jgi:hypothetical protein